MPVTSDAQEAPEYRDYLSREGEDSNLHYDVKIRAAKLLLGHTDDTFVTPVFNGSASLRDAAGQLIENTVKSVKRGETIDDAYMEKLFGSVTSLYRLNRMSPQAASGEKAELGALPRMSKVLLTVLAVIWVLLGGWALWEQVKKKHSGSA